MAQPNQDASWNWIRHSAGRSFSLKKRLLTRITLILTVVWLSAAIFSKFMIFDRTRSFLEKQVDMQLVDWLELAASQSIEPFNASHHIDRFLMVWKNNQLLIHNGEFELQQPQGKSEYVHNVNQENWVISEDCLNNICVAVGVADNQRKMLVRMLVALLFIPLLIVFVLTIMAIYAAVVTTLNPLNKLAKTVSKTPPDRLKNISLTNQSEELKPLIVALNQLIENMHLQLQKERQFLDTCTHELRTPIAALVASVQSLEGVDDSLKNQLTHIQQSAFRTARVANQFLALASNRNAENMGAEASVFDLCELIRQLSSDIMHENPRLNCRMQGIERLMIKGDIFAIEVAVRNIIENSVKYAVNPEDNRVDLQISIEQHKDLVYIEFDDSGAGVEPEYQSRILERFFRLPSKVTPGAGLGLAIVQETVLRYGGTVNIGQSESMGGLSVCISLKHAA